MSPMINDKDELMQHAISVNALLTEYIEVHNELFKKQATFTSILKNLFVKRINFTESHVDTGLLLSKFQAKQEELNSIPPHKFAEQYSDYFDCLKEYFKSLLEAVEILNKRQMMLADKSVGDKVTWSEYSTIEKEYKSALSKYSELGGRLNSMTQRILW